MASATLPGVGAALGAALGDGGIGLGARRGERAHAPARCRRIGAALCLIGAGSFVVSHALAANGVEGFAANEAGDDGLADEVEFAFGAVVFGALPRALDDLEGFGAFLANGDDVALVGRGGAELV